MPSKLIADCCANHCGSRLLMSAMIKATAEIGIDIVKFQSFRADRLNKNWPDYDNAYQYYKQHELSEDDHIWLMGKCKEFGIEFLTTVFDLETVDFLCSIGLKMVKIASPDCNNWALIDKCIEKFDEVIISTGMHTKEEIRQLIDFINENNIRSNVSLLRCVSKYPAKTADYSFKGISKFQGISDHTMGTEAGKLVISLGANYLEKHFSLSRHLPGKDQEISGTPEEFAELVKWRDTVNLMMGQPWRKLSEEELANRDLYKRRWSG